MKELLWVCALILFLVTKTWTWDAVNYTSFNVGSDAQLNCSDKSWQELIYVIWTVDLKHKQCQVGNSVGGVLKNTCGDGKTLRNTSDAQSHLHIPDFSIRDVGLYKCELAYSGGSTTCNVSVSITAPPRISSWLEWRDDTSVVAVCKAEEGKPAATITWSHAGNFSSVEKLQSSNGFFSVESRLELPEGTRNTENVTCIVRHLYWQSEKKLRPKHLKVLHGLPYNVMCVLIFAAILMVLAGVLVFAHKKKIIPRCLPDGRLTRKPQPMEDVEEVEPYASYVQRVNSIYSSSTCVT